MPADPSRCIRVELLPMFAFCWFHRLQWFFGLLPCPTTRHERPTCTLTRRSFFRSVLPPSLGSSSSSDCSDQLVEDRFGSWPPAWSRRMGGFATEIPINKRRDPVIGSGTLDHPSQYQMKWQLTVGPLPSLPCSSITQGILWMAVANDRRLPKDSS